jgi:hypothetical protein
MKMKKERRGGARRKEGRGERGIKGLILNLLAFSLSVSLVYIRGLQLLMSLAHETL